MIQFPVGRGLPRPAVPALRASLLSLALLLAACGGGTSAPYAGPSVSSGGGAGTGSGGGGGATGAATPYGLFASTFIAYAAQTNGAFLHSVQKGDVYAFFGGNFGYGNYSSSQADMNRTGVYTIQAQAGATRPSTAADYFQVVVLAPGNGTFDISQAATLLVQMGNAFVPSGNIPLGPNANVFTVDLNNSVGGATPTADCAYDQTLASPIGPNQGPSVLGVRTYAIPLASFSCSIGSVALLQQSGITTVAVKVLGSKNPALVASEGDTISVGQIGFTGTVSAADQTSLGL